MKILYNIASRGRVHQFVETIKNIYDLSASTDYSIVVKLDEDDPELKHYMEHMVRLFETKEDLIIRIGKSISKIDAINRDIPQSGWDILVNLSDDQRFKVKGFDDFIRAAFKASGPDKFIHFPDSYKKAACCTLSIMDRAYFGRSRKVYEEDYYSLFCDLEATEVAKLKDCYVYMDLGFYLFEHRHYSNGLAKMDKTYIRNNTYKGDKAVYESRRNRNFDLEVEREPFLLIKYATRGRWRQFFAAIDNIYATIRTNQFKIVVSADNDDVEMNSPEVREWVKRYNNVELHYGNHKSKIAAINADINPATQWKWLVNMSDDMKFVEYGWDQKMLQDIRTKWVDGWDWFAHFNDGYVGNKLPTMSVIGRGWYDRTHYIYYPGYKSVSCDAEEMHKAQMLGRYEYFDSVYFHHIHPANTKEPSDYIYRRNHEFGEADTELYFARLKKKFGVENPVMIPEEMKPFL